MVAGNALMDLMMGGYGSDIEESLANFPVYQDLVKILKGTATDADVNELLAKLTDYMGTYNDYVIRFGEPSITEDEFNVIKTNLPELVRALAPILIADAQYTQATYGEDYSLYYTYSLIKNAEKLVIGHIPESIMPILKSLIPADEESDIKVPSTGIETGLESIGASVPSTGIIGETVIASLFGAILAIVFLGCAVSRKNSASPHQSPN